MTNSTLCTLCNLHECLPGKEHCFSFHCHRAWIGNRGFGSPKRRKVAVQAPLPAVKEAVHERCLFYDELVKDVVGHDNDMETQRFAGPPNCGGGTVPMFVDDHSDNGSDGSDGDLYRVETVDDSESNYDGDDGSENGDSDDSDGDDGSSDDTRSSGSDTNVVCCENCMRSPYTPRANENPVRSVVLQDVSVRGIHFKRK